MLPAGRVLPFGEAIGFGEPFVSPDGRKVLLARGGVTVASLATGIATRVSPGDEASAAWSPDSERIAFPGRANTGLYVVDLRTGRKRALLRTSTTWSPAWSRDGKWIAFARQIGYGPTQLYVAHPDGSALRRVSGYTPTAIRGLSWSRAGKLAFVGTRVNRETADLVIVDVRTRRVRVLARRLGDGTATWSPNGRTIAYAATIGRSNASAIYTVAADGSALRRLTPSWPPSYDTSPVWSADGKTLLFVRAPIGGGAARGIPEIWAMRADGSRQRRLTKPYPAGADNIEPAWAREPVHEEPPARPREVRHGGAVVLEVPFAVDGIAADGARAAIAPLAFEAQRDYRPTPPALLWRPGHRATARLVVSACGGVQQLVLAGDRLAFDCSNTFLDLIEQSVWVYDLRTRVPREVFFGHGGGPTQRGLYVDYVVGGSGLVAFGSERDDARGFARLRTLWRIDGLGSIALRSRATTGNVVAAGGARMAVDLGGGRVAILNRDGSPVRVLALRRRRPVSADPFAVDPSSPFRFAGRDLLLLERGTLETYDTVTGRLRRQRRVPRGAHLEAADARLVVYAAGTSLHVVARDGETTIHAGAHAHAALTARGLYYCFDVADRRYPGRVVFVPREALPR